MPVITYREALRHAMSEEIERDPNVVLMGEDIAEIGGSMGVTQGMLAEFGLPRNAVVALPGSKSLTARALELALFHTYAHPRISALLHKTGEFRRHGQKRYDDTGIIISLLYAYGYDSERAERYRQRVGFY